MKSHEDFDDFLSNWGLAAGALAVRNRGETVLDIVGGVEAAWHGPQEKVAPELQVPVTRNTLFDIASLTKLVTATALLRVLPRLGLTEQLPVFRTLPQFASPHAKHVTVAHLLTHTSGLPSTCSGDAQARARYFDQPAKLLAPAGTIYRYSCVGYIWAGLLLEQLCQANLGDIFQREIFDPLGMVNTGFRPGWNREENQPQAVAGHRLTPRDSVVATEYQSWMGRGLVQGSVHDETGWTLGGAAGNAGLFSTAQDLAKFSDALLDVGTAKARGLLGPRARHLMVSDQIGQPLVAQTPPYGQGCGPRIGEDWMVGTRKTELFGHTGFTGTSLMADRRAQMSIVFLSNRVHPVRTSQDFLEVRRSAMQLALRLGKR